MKNILLRTFLEELLKRHIPTYFIEVDYLTNIVNAICSKDELSRREILVLAYCLGANIEETNQFLSIMGYQPLYVKIWEDAVWRFAIMERKDLNYFINNVFP